MASYGRQTPPLSGWIGYIGPGGGSLRGEKYWVCDHTHHTEAEAQAHAQNELDRGHWHGRKWV
jgi:hypothetical protein